MNPAMLASMQGAALRGVQRNSYTLPDGSTYDTGSSVSREDPMGRDASYSGPGGSWSENFWGKPITSGIWQGMYPGQKTMEAIARGDSELAAWYRSQGVNLNLGNRPSGSRTGSSGGSYGGGQYVPGGSGTVPAGQSPYIGLPSSSGQSRTQAARGPWMQEMGSGDAQAQQMALVAALKGGG